MNNTKGLKEVQGPVLFYPFNESKNLKTVYPELNNIDEFQDLNNMELLFAYYFGVYYDHLKNDSDRLKKAMWKIGTRWDEGTRNKYLNGKIPEKVKKAIIRMRQYDVSTRFRAKAMTEKILENFESIVALDKDDFLLEGDDGTIVDWQSIKDHTKLCVDISKSLPDIVKQVEAGYGVRDVKLSGKNLTEGSPLDEYHRQE